MSGCCRGLSAKDCWARPHGCGDGPSTTPPHIPEGTELMGEDDDAAMDLQARIDARRGYALPNGDGNVPGRPGHTGRRIDDMALGPVIATAGDAGPFTPEMKEVAARMERLTFKDMTLLGAMVAGALDLEVAAETKARGRSVVGSAPGGSDGPALMGCVVRSLLSVAESVRLGQCVMPHAAKVVRG